MCVRFDVLLVGLFDLVLYGLLFMLFVGVRLFCELRCWLAVWCFVGVSGWFVVCDCGGFAAVFWVVSFVVCCLLLIMLWYVVLYLIVVVWCDCFVVVYCCLLVLVVWLRLL